MAQKRKKPIVPARSGSIEDRIRLVRGLRVMLDEDLAELYGVTTGRLNEQVTRNEERFPDDFAFRITLAEYRVLISHFAISRHGGRRKPPRVFTEHGAVMLASVLKTPIAIEASILVVRAFVYLRTLLEARHRRTEELAELERRLGELEARTAVHDGEIGEILEAIRLLMAPPREEGGDRIGFPK